MYVILPILYLLAKPNHQNAYVAIHGQQVSTKGIHPATRNVLANRATHAPATPCASIREAKSFRSRERRTRTWQSRGSGPQQSFLTPAPA